MLTEEQVKAKEVEDAKVAEEARVATEKAEKEKLDTEATEKARLEAESKAKAEEDAKADDGRGWENVAKEEKRKRENLEKQLADKPKEPIISDKDIWNKRADEVIEEMRYNPDEIDREDLIDRLKFQDYINKKSKEKLDDFSLQKSQGIDNFIKNLSERDKEYEGLFREEIKRLPKDVIINDKVGKEILTYCKGLKAEEREMEAIEKAKKDVLQNKKIVSGASTEGASPGASGKKETLADDEKQMAARSGMTEDEYIEAKKSLANQKIGRK